MTLDNTAIIVAMIAALPGVFSLFVAFRKNGTDRAEFIQDASVELLKPLKERIDAQEKTIREQARHIRHVEAQLTTVIAENEQLRVRIRNLEQENMLLTKRLEAAGLR